LDHEPAGLIGPKTNRILEGTIIISENE